jgi:FKBP-type peptidyl-prolyl cis-trans isomerase SlyD
MSIGHNEILAPSGPQGAGGQVRRRCHRSADRRQSHLRPRDESLVFSDRIENVPEEYRQVGTSILMENDKGKTAASS